MAFASTKAPAMSAKIVDSRAAEDGRNQAFRSVLGRPRRAIASATVMPAIFLGVAHLLLAVA